MRKGGAGGAEPAPRQDAGPAFGVDDRINDSNQITGKSQPIGFQRAAGEAAPRQCQECSTEPSARERCVPRVREGPR